MTKKSRPSMKDICFECYKNLYKEATPSGDFMELVKNATIDDDGKQHINFMDYELSEITYKKIVDSFIKKYRMNGLDEKSFSFEMYLGCGPKTVWNNKKK